MAIMAHYIRVKEGVLTIMLECHGQYWIPSDNIDFMARMRSMRDVKSMLSRTLVLDA